MQQRRSTVNRPVQNVGDWAIWNFGSSLTNQRVGVLPCHHDRVPWKNSATLRTLSNGPYHGQYTHTTQASVQGAVKHLQPHQWGHFGEDGRGFRSRRVEWGWDNSKMSAQRWGDHQSTCTLTTGKGGEPPLSPLMLIGLPGYMGCSGSHLATAGFLRS